MNIYQKIEDWADRLERAFIQSSSRSTSKMLTMRYLYEDVRKIKNVEVSGDTIAELTRRRVK